MNEIDTSILGKATAQFMTDLEEAYNEQEDIRLGEVVISVEVFQGDEGIDVATSSSTDNIIHQTGILNWALDKITNDLEEVEEEDD